MKRVWIGLVALVAGCGDPLKHDVEMFCNAVVGSTATDFMSIGPYVAEHSVSTEFKTMLGKVPGGHITIWEIDEQVRGWMKQTGVTRCKTLDVVVRPRPVASEPAPPPPPRPWVLYTHPDQLMSVRFPAEPTENDKEAPSPTGPVRFKIVSFDDAKRSYAATAIAFPPTSKFSAKGFLDTWRDRVVGKTTRAKLVSEKPIKLDGHDGREIIFEDYTPENIPVRGIVRMFAWAQPPLAFMVNATAASARDQTDPDAQKFLDSLRIAKHVEIKH